MLDFITLDFIESLYFDLPIWGIVFLFAYSLVLILSLEKATRRGVPTDDIFKFISFTAVASLIGSRIAYLIINQSTITLAQTFSWGDVFYKGNVNIVGGYVTATIVGLIYLQAFDVIKRSQMSWLRFLDSFLYIIPLGMAFGYVGISLITFNKGAVSNIVYPWLLEIDGKYLHPWAIYIGIGYLLLFMLLFTLNQRAYDFRRPGYLTGLFVILVSMIHFFADFYQTDNILYGLPRTYGLTITQWVSLGVLIIGCIVILYMREMHTKEQA